MVPLYNGILDRSKKRIKSYLAIAWMEIENITLSELNQSVRDKYHMISRTCGI